MLLSIHLHSFKGLNWMFERNVTYIRYITMYIIFRFLCCLWHVIVFGVQLAKWLVGKAGCFVAVWLLNGKLRHLS